MKLDNELLRSLPKVLLHEHLDGVLRPQTVIELARAVEYAGLPTADPETLAQWFHRGANQGSLAKYLEGFTHTIAVMQTEEALERVAYEQAEDLSKDGVVYFETRFAPIFHTQKGLTHQQVVSAVLKGLERGRKNFGIASGLIICAMRNMDVSLEMAELAVDFRARGVVGFDLAGEEGGYPPKKHVAAFHYIQRPSFLSRLRPLMADLGALADQGTPVVSSLDESASALDRQFAELVPFASAARTALIDLGNAAQQSQAPLLASESLATRLSKLGAAAVPSSALLDQLTASLDKSGAINQLMRLLFYGTGASNGFDADGHYLRTSAIFGDCTAYALRPQPGCSSNFGPGAAAADVASAAGPATPNRAGAGPAGRSTTPDAAGQSAGGASGAAGLAQSAPSGASEQPTKLAQDSAAVAAVVREALALSPPPRSSPLAGLLQYLIGGAR